LLVYSEISCLVPRGKKEHDQQIKPI
jgi:hypothetical protein